MGKTGPADAWYERPLKATFHQTADEVHGDPASVHLRRGGVLVLPPVRPRVIPPARGWLEAEALSNHYYYEFPGLAHGIMRSNACGLEIDLQFLEDPGSEPDACFINALGTPDFW